MVAANRSRAHMETENYPKIGLKWPLGTRDAVPSPSSIIIMFEKTAYIYYRGGELNFKV